MHPNRPTSIPLLLTLLAFPALALAADCNENGIDDAQDIASLTSIDCDNNGTPDECQIKFNSPASGGPFFCIAGCDRDCNKSGIPDSCELAANDCNANRVPDDCELDDRLIGTGSGFAFAIDPSTGASEPISGHGLRGRGAGTLALDPHTQTLYGASSSELFLVNRDTGAVDLIGPTASGGFVAYIEFDSVNNELLAIDDRNDVLLKLDVATGLATPVGPLGYISLRDLAFDANSDTLYGTDFITRRLLSISRDTGAATAIATVVGSGHISGLAFDPASNILFGIDSDAGELVTIDPATGVATPIASGVNAGSLIFDASDGYLYSGGDRLTKIDPTTGGHEVLHFLSRSDLSALSVDPNSGRLFGAYEPPGAEDLLIVIDPLTAASSVIGPIGFEGLSGLAFDSATGALYGVDEPTGQLIEIDTQTGAGIAVGPIGFDHLHPGLAFDPMNGVLFAIALILPNELRLITIDPATGAGTPGPQVSGSAVFGLTYNPGAQKLYAAGPVTGTLFEIDPVTGAGAFIGLLGFFDVNAMAFDQNSGTLFGTDRTMNELFSVNLETGRATTIGSITRVVSGLAFDPTTDRVYGMNIDPSFGVPSQLIQMNSVTGAVTPIGPLTEYDIRGFVFDAQADMFYGVDPRHDFLVAFDRSGANVGFTVGSLSFDGVSGLAFDPANNVLFASDDNTDQLITIDPWTAAAVAIGPIGFSRVLSLALDPATDTLYGIDSSTTQLIRLDRNTGAGSSIGPTRYTSVGLTFVPADCNANSIPDGCDVASGASADLDANGLPDECEPPDCGDGVLSEGEQCDDGSLNSNAVPDACRINCRHAACGDHVIDSGEQCDNGTANSDSLPDACRTNCVLAYCGDGVGDAGEACDSGTSNSETTPDACRTDCTLAACGDDVVDSGEECDGSNDSACLAECTGACTCIDVIPTVSQWGLAVLALLLLIVGKIRFARASAPSEREA